LVDERDNLVAGEAATSLTLGESHGAPRVSKVGVAGLLEERQQLLHLLGRGRWT
jgi:hypothetical protein